MMDKLIYCSMSLETNYPGELERTENLFQTLSTSLSDHVSRNGVYTHLISSLK